MIGPMATTDHPTAALLDLAVRTARAAGAELLRRYGRVEGLDTKSSLTDPVSDADRAAEALIVTELTAARPDDGLIGEEGAERPSTSGLTWVIDPLDGTVNYLYELDNFAVSIACEDAEGGVVGVVFDPVRDLLFSAVRGEGATLTTAGGAPRPLRVSQPGSLSATLLSTGFGYSASRRALQGALVAQLLPKVRDIRRIGSAALDLCAVAAGRLDAFYEEGVQHWDVAAGGLIAREAGALMTPLTLTDATTGWVVASAVVHAELSALLESLRPVGPAPQPA